MDLPSAVLLVVLVALGVMIVIVLEHRLSRIRRRSRTTAPDAAEPRPDPIAEIADQPFEQPFSEPSGEPLDESPATADEVPQGEEPAATAAEPPFEDRLTHVLMQRDTELATLTTQRLDPPWLECTFEATSAFDPYRPLFDRELELLQHPGGTFDQAAFVEQWQRIFGAGLWIRADPEGHHVSQFLLHIQPDGTARLRYG